MTHPIDLPFGNNAMRELSISAFTFTSLLQPFMKSDNRRDNFEMKLVV
jgi:hypothetical protein